jgi:predicted ribonuclease toxin of YeeF-YezG toxin-antitoxin module
MKDKTQYLTHAGRAELIRAKFDNLSAKDELWVDTMLIEAFLDGWEHGVDRYKQIMESLKKGGAA